MAVNLTVEWFINIFQIAQKNSQRLEELVYNNML
jgi:hypothetical protein